MPATVLPGVTVTTSGLPTAAGSPSATGRAFVCGQAQKGPTDRATRVGSLADFAATYGDPVAYSGLSAWVETAFAEGLAELWVARDVGPAAAAAAATLKDASGVNTLTVTALNPGDWGNGLAVQRLAGSTPALFTVSVQQGGVERERYVDLASPAVAETVLATSGYVRGTSLGSPTAVPGNQPAVATTPLAGGTDDRVNITDVQRAATLALFSRDLGAGQVAWPSQPTPTVHALLLAHAQASRRFALCDGPNLPSVGALVALAQADSQVPGADRGLIAAPWVTVPPAVPGGPPRVVQASALVAGLIATVDATSSPDTEPAGTNGTADFATGLSGPGFSDADRATLNGGPGTAGVSVVRYTAYQGVQLYGFRTVSTDPTWYQGGPARERMYLETALQLAADRRATFAKIDSRGTAQADLHGDLVAVLDPEKLRGGVFAYSVDTGPTVNPTAQLAQGVVAARVNVQLSPAAERVAITVVAAPITAAAFA